VSPLRAVASGPAGVRVYAARENSAIHFVVKWVQDAPELKYLPPARAVPPLEIIPESGSEAVAEEVNPVEMIGSALRTASVTGTDRNPGGMECGHARVRLGFDGGGSAATVRITAVEEGGVRAVRFRPLKVNLSVSRLKNDREPVYSVSFGWAGSVQEFRWD
jgi:hypothetical protein